MKILYVITSTETGGAEKALFDLAAYMVKQRHQIRILCLKPLGAVADQMRQNGIEVKTIGKRFPGKTIHCLRSEIISFEPDIVHALLFRAIEYTRLACAGLAVKVVITPHFDLSKKSFFFRLMDQFLKFRDTLAIAESFSTATYLINHQKYAKDKVYLLPNSIDKTQFHKDNNLRETMRKKYSFHVKTVVFICVARLAPVKDPMTLLQAFRNVWMRNPDVRLVYVGEGEERAKMEAYIRQSGMDKCVALFGEQADVNSFLNMADVFVLPSVEESLPLALLEALTVGLPCIVSRVGDMPLWVEHGKNGYVFNPGDITLLSCLLNLLVDNPHARAEMGAKSLIKAAQTVDSFTQYQQVYQQLITGQFSRENLSVDNLKGE